MPPDLRRLAEAKRQYEEERPPVAERLAGLDARGAASWGGEVYARGKQAFDDAESGFAAKGYEAALSRLRDSGRDLVAVEKLAAGILRDTLAAGFAAIDAGNAAEARKQFELAARIDPASAAARRGLKRAATLDEVRRLMVAAADAERSGQAASAEASYRKALQLDPDTSAARDALLRLQQRRQTPLSFSKLSKLQEGPNTTTVGLVDKAGAEVKKTIIIIRKIPIARQIGPRLSVVVYPFKEQKQQVPLTDYVQTFLTHSFVNQKRFYILERQELEKILQEQQMTQEAVFDQKTAVKLRRMMVAETIILGDILASEKSVEVIARMVDTETSVILAEKDVYWEGTVRTGFREILDGLALKFKQQFPLCEWIITAKKPAEVQFNLGAEHAICKGMRFLAFNGRNPASMWKPLAVTQRYWDFYALKDGVRFVLLVDRDGFACGELMVSVTGIVATVTALLTRDMVPIYTPCAFENTLV